MKPCILYRTDRAFDAEERTIAERYFPVYRLRSDIPDNSLVVGRNSVLPYYKELTEDLKYSESRLINSLDEHRFVADLGEWYHVLSDLTFKTWTWDGYVRSDYNGPVVLKGGTNSKKRQWRTHMYAANQDAATQVMLRLADDDLIAPQGIYVREYHELASYGTNVVGQPIADEYRFFIYKDTVLAKGFYWSSNTEDIDGKPDANTVPVSLVNEVMRRVGPYCSACVVDFARTADGEWLVVELNSLQMSGLSDCSADDLYRNLRSAIDNDPALT